MIDRVEFYLKLILMSKSKQKLINKFKLIDQYLESNEDVVKILKKYEIHFVPVLNPDGYEFSRASRVRTSKFLHICKKLFLPNLYVIVQSLLEEKHEVYKSSFDLL